MKKSTFSIVVLLLLVSFFSFSQNKNTKHIDRCGTYQHNQQLLLKNPEMMGSKAFEEKLKPLMQAYKTKRTASSKNAIITIPVVVHVLHNGEPIGIGANISEAQVLSQIAVLNQDFRRISGTRGFGGGVDVEVQFSLAKQDPSGCPTNGINRVNIGQDGINETTQENGSDQMDLLKPSSIWNRSQYLNIWSVKYTGGSGLLGYAQLPGGSASTDGVVVDCKYFGSNDDPNVILGGAYNLGRTMTHEVGHFLGLLHTWGDEWAEGDPDDASCNADDGITDTPNTGRPNNGCPTLIPDTCTDPGVDMIENYMDYSDDVCMDTFTAGQKTLMQGILAGSRASLASSTKSDLPSGINNDASAKVVFLDTPNCTLNVIPAVRFTNWGDNTMTSASLSYNVDGGSPLVYNWSGSLTKGSSQVVNLPTVISTSGNHIFNITVTNVNGGVDQRACNNIDTSDFIIDDSYGSTAKVFLTLNLDGYASETSWEFRNGSNVLIASANYTSPADNNKTKNVEFNVNMNDCYTFTIDDSYGDGLCCDNQGSFTLQTDDMTIIATGGDFTSSETVAISTAVLSTETFFIDNAIRIYPNPTNTILNIKLSNSNELPDGYKIYNRLGQLVKQEDVNNMSQLSIDASSFANGMYFIRIFKENQSISIPFIKN